MAVFPYNTMILTSVVNGKEFKTPSYLRDTFFSNVMTSKAKFIMFDKLPDGDRSLAPFINRRVGGKLIELEGYKTEMYEPPVVGNHFVVTPEDAFTRAPGHTEYDLAGPKSYLNRQINKGLRRIENMISRREEWMCAQALIKGEIAIQGDGVSDIVKYWSQLDPAEQPVTTLATPWTDNGTTVDSIIEDLNTIIDAIVLRCGLVPRKIICGKTVARALCKVMRNSETFDIKRVEAGSHNPDVYKTGIRYLGYLADPGIEVYSYIDLYEEGGEVHPIIPNDVALVVSPEVNTIMAYGAIADGWTASGDPNIVSGTRFSFDREHDSLEKGRSIFLQAAPLPILQNIDGFHVIKAG